MSNSISGTTTAVHLPVRFVLNRFIPNEHTQRIDEAAKQRAALRKTRHETELLAAEYARVMLERHIAAALDPKTDPVLAAKLRNDVMNRGIGKVRDTEDDDPDTKKKGGTVAEFLEALAAISTAAAVVERVPRVGHAERDITHIPDDNETERFLRDLSGDDEGKDDD